MSKTGAISFNYSIPNGKEFINTINILIDNQWSVDKFGIIFFMVEGNYDYKYLPIKYQVDVFNKIIESVNYKFDTSIDLIWKDNKTVIELFYAEGFLKIFISEEIKRTKDGFNIDFPFYLEKLKPILENVKENDIKLIYN